MERRDMNLRHALLSVFAVSLLAASGCGKKETPPDGAAPSRTSSSVAELRQTAKDAYIFFYPLVLNYRTMYSQAIKGDGGFGKWLHLDLAQQACSRNVGGVTSLAEQGRRKHLTPVLNDHEKLV